jgi:anaerobic magnesium-protoporphyrin IX monomethyl ester cyclase
MKSLLLNSPWINSEKEYGVKAGTRWASIRSRDRFLPYFPYPYFLASATATLKQAGFEAYAKDAIAEEISKEECMKHVAELKPALLVIECFTPSASYDLAFMKEAKERTGCYAVFSGVHAGALPKEILGHDFMDFVLMGEIDHTLRELVQFLNAGRTDFEKISGLAFKRNGEVIVNSRRPPIDNLDLLPFPERDDLPMDKYNEPFSKSRATARITVSRGCPFRCSFCIEPFVYSGSYKHRSIPLVIEEIKLVKEKYGVKEIFFDDSIFMTAWAIEIANALIESKVEIDWSCWVDWNIKYEHLELMKKSGCIGVKFGIESVDPQILKTSHKPVKIDRIKELIQNCKKLDLLRLGSFCLGLPGETPESMLKTIDLAFSYDLTSCQVSIATPLPGTEFYREAEKNGWLTTKNWDLYEANNSFVLEYGTCTKDDVLKAMDLVRKKKVRQFLKNPVVAFGYVYKLYKAKGFKSFLKDIYHKLIFVVQSLLPVKTT